MTRSICRHHMDVSLSLMAVTMTLFIRRQDMESLSLPPYGSLSLSLLQQTSILTPSPTQHPLQPPVLSP
ncbi:hypothetical protein T11_9349 [Trichinella zimbabwensis]|uniref:Uncharacterized protein n=1 Tax=Trichinella zimbabwensis TaxID=268475 RepID=A0A0V1GK22_9BILA|nr:hypothetical protein T11_9349 [Trichinella zimbabwensis]